MRTKSHRCRRIRLEPLEPRLMLAITVDTLIDELDGSITDGDISLRDAIAAAEAAEIIDFAVTGTITLTLGELLIDKSLIINGPGAELLTIDASGMDPTPTQNNGDGIRIFNINDGNNEIFSDVTLTGLRLTGGDENNSGGAIFTRENLVVANSTITGNATTIGGIGLFGGGGGIFSLYGSLTVLDSIISDNQNVNGEGGGIRKRFGSLTIERSTLSENRARLAGGGVSAADGGVLVQIRDSTFTGNSVTGPEFGGGGLFIFRADATLTATTISGNSAPTGAGLNTRDSTVRLIDSTVSGNSANQNGGGLYSRIGNLSITGSTISGNTAMNGAGVYSSNGQLTITNGTILGNIAENTGGGVFVQGTGAATVQDSSFENNQSGVNGGGFATDVVNASITVTDSEFSDNSTGDDGGGVYVRADGGNAQLADLLVQRNDASGSGLFGPAGGGIFGWIFNSGRLVIHDSIIRENTQTGANSSGAGIEVVGESAARVSIANNSISDNSATGDNSGGGGVSLFFGGQSVFELLDNQIERNSAIGANTRGGGVIARSDASQLLMSGGLIAHNSATGGGGGIFVNAINSGSATIALSRIESNAVMGDGAHYGGGAELRADTGSTIRVDSTSVVGNTSQHIAGGIRTLNAGNSTIIIENSLVADNSAARFGGGLHLTAVDGQTLISNSTISGNHANLDGSGFNVAAREQGPVTIQHSTIVRNTIDTVPEDDAFAAGLKVFSGAVAVANSILAENENGDGSLNDLGVEDDPASVDPDSEGLIPGSLATTYSLIGFTDLTGPAETIPGTPDAQGNLIGGASNGPLGPLLAALTDNGGPTLTHALLHGSPASNAGDPAATSESESVPPFDQRGEPFPRVVNGRIDIGAFESNTLTNSAAFRTNTGFTENRLERDDDNSTGLVSIGFDINFFGALYSNLYVNNNGNVTFTLPLSEYTPSNLLAALTVIIAPFWADVDTRGTGLVTYGQDTVDGHAAFGVNWIDVGYFDSELDKTNTFQLVLIDRSDRKPGDFDFEFNFAQVQWETGSHPSSGGVDGLGGNSARAGFSNGANRSFELPGSDVDGAFLDVNSQTGLIHHSLNSSVLGRYRFEIINGKNPVAVDDFAGTPSGTPVTIDVLANDSDSDGFIDPTSIAIVNQPANGSVIVDPVTGAITYIPASSFLGRDSFTYTVRDDRGAVSNIATVMIEVTPEDEPPTPVEPIAPTPPPPIDVPFPTPEPEPPLLLILEEPAPPPVTPLLAINADYGTAGYTYVPPDPGNFSSGGTPQAVDAALGNDEVDEPFLLAGFLDFVDPEMLVVDLGDEPPTQIAAESTKAATGQQSTTTNTPSSGDQIGANSGGATGGSDHSVENMKPPLAAGVPASSADAADWALQSFAVNNWRWFASTAAALLLCGAAWKSRDAWLEAARKLRSR
ncbi:MAG: nidogen-like domain-containing protein [Pirellulales bacterium]